MAQSASAATGMIFEAGDEREPFAAYLTDDASQAAAGGGEPARLVDLEHPQGRPRRRPAPPRRRSRRFMIVDIEGLPGASRRSRAASSSSPGSQVMAPRQANDVNYFRRVMRTGARDYLMKPVDADELGKEVFVRLEQKADGVTPKGRVVGFIGARGGVGTTTLGTNTAFLMTSSRAAPRSSTWTPATSRSRSTSSRPALREAFDNPERVDQTFLQNAMAKFSKNCTCWRPRKASTTPCACPTTRCWLSPTSCAPTST